MENQPYNAGHPVQGRSGKQMPKKRIETGEGFGARLAALRKRAGFTQEELAEELGTSQRMIAYYESPPALPPSALLPKIAKALGVSTDVLHGVERIKRGVKPRNTRLQRRLEQIDQLAPTEKRQVLQVLDAFIERGKLRRKAAG
jgi:transcriptional regulator with XRE-family HTH domain